jgi:hypothetical protein
MTSQPTKRSSRSAWVSELPNLPPSSEDRYGCPIPAASAAAACVTLAAARKCFSAAPRSPRREYPVLVASYCHTSIIALYRYMVISFIGNNLPIRRS